MPELQMTTKTAKEVWRSPDGQRVLYQLGLEYQGKPVTAKTYSREVATPGWSGVLQTREEQGKYGVETFVRQPPKENVPSSTGQTAQGGTARSGYTPKDEKAIQAMWAIGQAVQVTIATYKGKDPSGTIEALAKELFVMVDRVKVGAEPLPEEPDEIIPVTDDPVDLSMAVDLSQVEAVFGPAEKEEPWANQT